MTMLFRPASLALIYLFLALFVGAACDLKTSCSSDSECPAKHSCKNENCVPWQCQSSAECFKYARVCDEKSHTCRKCEKHQDCIKGRYCFEGTCGTSNPTCTTGAFIEVCRGCSSTQDCPDGLTCEKYSPSSDKMICKR